MDLAFIQEIARDPDNDLPRLIYADWLEEQGDPRAEFIRCQCEVTRLDATGADPWQAGLLRRQAKDLLNRHREEWLSPFWKYLGRQDFSRGFLESVSLPVHRLLESEEEIARKTLMLEFIPNQGRPEWDQLVQSPLLERVRTLNLSAYHREQDLLVSLLQSPRLTQLTKLDLTGMYYTADQFRELVTLPIMSRLRALILNGVNLAPTIPQPTWSILFSDARLSPDLEELRLQFCGLQNWTLGQLLNHSGLPGLKKLSLGANPLTPPGWQAVRQTEQFPLLEELDLTGSRFRSNEYSLRPEALPFILESSLPYRRLILDDNNFNDQTARLIEEHPRLQRLKYLSLANNQITSRGYGRLHSATRHLDTLVVNLKGNPLSGPEADSIRRHYAPHRRQSGASFIF